MHSQQYSDQAMCADLAASCEHLMLGSHLCDWDPSTGHASTDDWMLRNSYVGSNLIGLLTALRCSGARLSPVNMQSMTTAQTSTHECNMGNMITET